MEDFPISSDPDQRAAIGIVINQKVNLYRPGDKNIEHFYSSCSIYKEDRQENLLALQYRRREEISMQDKWIE